MRGTGSGGRVGGREVRVCRVREGGGREEGEGVRVCERGRGKEREISV